MALQSNTVTVLARGADIAVAVGRQRKLLVADAIEAVDAIQADIDQCWANADADHNGMVDISEIRGAMWDHGLLGESATKDDLLMLMNFVVTDQGNVKKEELIKILTLWKLRELQHPRWEEFLGARVWDAESVLELLRVINGQEAKVVQHEAEWVYELANSTNTSEEDRLHAAVLAVCYWTCFARPRHGLLRQKMIQRVQLERDFGVGCIRFILLLTLFYLFTQALVITRKSGFCRGIHNNLVAQFDLERVESLNTWGSVGAFLEAFSQNSVALAPLSKTYFSQGADLNLMVEQRTFDAPLILPQTKLWLGTGFTMMAWVSLEPGTFPPRGGLPIFRRSLALTGEGADMSCISWNFPPALAFGAHDYGGGNPNPVTGLHEEYVEAGTYPTDPERRRRAGVPLYEEFDQMVLHTLVVNGSRAWFYVNDGVLVGNATVDLPRMVTDCEGAENIVGARGLTLAAVTHLPVPLSSRDVAETFRQGTLLSNMGYGIKFTEVEQLSSQERLGKRIEVESIDADIDKLDTSLEVTASAALSALAVTNPVVQTPAYSNEDLQVPTGVDAVLGHPVWRILDGPTYTDASSRILASASAVPKVTSAGLTISAWLKFKSAGNGYLLARSMPAADPAASGGYRWTGYSDMCWLVYVGGGATEFRLRSSATGHAYGASVLIEDDKAPADEQFTAQSYRHFVFQVDPANSSEPVTICIDGNCHTGQRTVSAQDGFPPADCEDSSYLEENYADNAIRQGALSKAKVWVGARPPGAWAFTGFIKNMKMFDRALNRTEIQELFLRDPDPEDANGAPMKQTGGCKIPTELMDDTTFTDDFGHGCLWYFNARQSKPFICERSRVAKARCPVACVSSEVCWGASGGGSAPSMSIWDRQIDFRSKGTWGTTCVAMSTTPEKEAIKCGLSANNDIARCAAPKINISSCAPVNCTAFEHDREALLDCLGDVASTAAGSDEPRFLPCAEIIRTHEPTCDWDDTGLDEMAQAINASSEWSLEFWVESVYATECLQPGMRLLDGDGVTFSWLGGWKQVVLDPPSAGCTAAHNDAGGCTGCNTNTWLSHALHGKKSDGYPHLSEADVTVAPNFPRPGEKHLVVMGRMANGFVALQWDAASNTDNANQNGGHPPIKADRSFLRVINVLGNVRLSNMRLRASYPAQGDITKVRYTELPKQLLRRGAHPIMQTQVTSNLKREAKLFTEKTFLVAPPVIFQTRGENHSCGWTFSDTVIETFYELGRRRQCSTPYECQDYSQKSVYQCAKGESNATFFGLVPQDNEYLEFLSTMTDFPIIVRPRAADGKLEVMRTENFLDTLTSSIRVAAVFFSAEFGITTKLDVVFQMTEGTVTGSYDMQHFVAMTGDDLEQFTMVQGFMVCAQIFLLIDNIRVAVETWRDWRARMPVNLHHVALKTLVDLVIQIGALTFSILMGRHVDRSGTVTEDLIMDLQSFNWADQMISFDTKKGNFRTLVDHLTADIERATVLNTVGMVIAMVIFVRVISATSAHPRIAMMTETLKIAGSDMVHFSMLFVLVLWGFAIVGSWRFGDTRSDFRDIKVAMQTQFDCILDPPGSLPVNSAASEDPEYLVFVVILHFVNFFFLVNFFLAIVVGAFLRNVQLLEDCDVEQDMVSDLWGLVKCLALSVLYRWPGKGHILRELDGICFKYISVDDLIKWGFRNEHSAVKFYEHYSDFEFIINEAQKGPTLETIRDDSMIVQSKVKTLSDQLVKFSLGASSASPEAMSRRTTKDGLMTRTRSFVTRRASVDRQSDKHGHSQVLAVDGVAQAPHKSSDSVRMRSSRMETKGSLNSPRVLAMSESNSCDLTESEVHGQRYLDATVAQHSGRGGGRSAGMDNNKEVLEAIQRIEAQVQQERAVAAEEREQAAADRAEAVRQREACEKLLEATLQAMAAPRESI